MTDRQCRTCLAQFSTRTLRVNVEEYLVDNMNVLEAIQDLVPLEPTYDQFLPTEICRKCFNILKSIILFKRCIINSYNQITEKYITLNTEDLVPHIKIEENIDSLEKRDETYSCIEDGSNESIDEKPSLEYKLSLNKGAEDKTQLPLVNKDSTNLHLCTICEFVLNGTQEYNEHMKTHDDIPPLVFSCPVCSKIFSQKDAMIIHKRIHNGEKPYQCEICNKYFTLKCSYTTHKKRAHSGICSYCRKKFTDKYELFNHIKMKHTGFCDDKRKLSSIDPEQPQIKIEKQEIEEDVKSEEMVLGI